MFQIHTCLFDAYEICCDLHLYLRGAFIEVYIGSHSGAVYLLLSRIEGGIVPATEIFYIPVEADDEVSFKIGEVRSYLCRLPVRIVTDNLVVFRIYFHPTFYGVQAMAQMIAPIVQGRVQINALDD